MQQAKEQRDAEQVQLLAEQQATLAAQHEQLAQKALRIASEQETQRLAAEAEARGQAEAQAAATRHAEAEAAAAERSDDAAASAATTEHTNDAVRPPDGDAETADAALRSFVDDGALFANLPEDVPTANVGDDLQVPMITPRLTKDKAMHAFPGAAPRSRRAAQRADADNPFIPECIISASHSAVDMTESDCRHSQAAQKGRQHGRRQRSSHLQ